MLKLNHKNLDVWNLAIDFISDIYEISSNFPKAELYGLNAQIRRASISIASNISEGAARKSLIERKRFFEIARSSLVEVDTQIEIAINLKYLESKELLVLEKNINQLFAKLSNLIKNAK